MSVFVLVYSYVAAVLGVAGGVRQAHFRSGLAILALLPLVVLPAFRAENVGRDTVQYHHIFNLIIKNPDHHYIQFGIEPLFKYLVVFLNALGLGASSLIALAAVLFFVATWRLIRSYSPSYSLSILVLLSIGPFFFIFSGLRQSIAIAIILFAFSFLYHRRFIAFVGTVLLAMGFHLSSAVFLSVYLLRKNIVSVILLVAAWTISLAFALIPSLAIKLVELGSALVPVKYMALLEAGTLVDAKNLSVRFIFSQVLFVVIAASCFRRGFFEQAWLPSLVSMAGIVVGNAFLNTVALGRISWYFEIFHVLTIPLLARYWFGGMNYILATVCLFATFYSFYLRQLVTDAYHIFPYSLNLAW